MKYQFVQDEKRTYEVPATVVQVEPSRLLIQQGGMTGVITYRHEYRLEPVAEVRFYESRRVIEVSMCPSGIPRRSNARINV